MVTIIFTHPSDTSFNRSILDTVICKLQEKGTHYNLIDLYKDGFNPAMTAEELSLHGQGKSNDELVLRYQSFLKETTEAIFIFPVWWGNPPAMLKGFIDKVFLYGFSCTMDENGFRALLNIEKTLFITTTGGRAAMFEKIIKDSFISDIFKRNGFYNSTWLNSDETSFIGDEKRGVFLKEVEQYVI